MSIVGNNDLDKREQERVARVRQEIVENKTELAAKLYKYNGPALKGTNCFLLTGDYMMFQDNNLFSSRGAQLPMSTEQLVEMLDDKTMSQLGDNFTLGKYVRLYLKLLIDSTTSSSIESNVISSTPFLANTFPIAVPIAPLPTKTTFFIKKILCKFKVFLPN
mgnify:CR=1 FL=1